jgi:hypothetical protein
MQLSTHHALNKEHPLEHQSCTKQNRLAGMLMPSCGRVLGPEASGLTGNWFGQQATGERCARLQPREKKGWCMARASKRCGKKVTIVTKRKRKRKVAVSPKPQAGGVPYVPEPARRIGSWGGSRKGAGRKRELGLSDRREIAGDYFARMQKRRNNRSLREALIRELMDEYNLTHRMVVRCVAELLPDFRRNTKMYKYAIEGAKRIQPLPARNINKRAFKPGVYEENKARRKLRLIVDSTGKCTWIFPFCWGTTIHHMVLGGQELSLTKARELATKASRKLAAEQNPINDS